ncbi:hypothetical protein ETB97_011149 [Aspergillus alliaceus]|uniref:Tachykinin family protein n=1 Tax=Petromyces alliaceus TaxID=209559 RepID=A0A8H6E7Z8_PETAA|nr:hypothetical protein ETB97_011149 [Aspergillus burnettii]
MPLKCPLYFYFGNVDCIFLGPKPATITPPDRPSFTFIDHDDDLSSKRIKDANARRAIRSHVMRDVRRRERLAGLKRVSRREGLAGKAAAQPNPEDSPSERVLPIRSTISSSESNLLTGRGPACEVVKFKEKRRQQPERRLISHSASTSSISIPLPFPSSWLLDPFSSLPGAGDVPITISRLVFYWGTVFVPMTFPTEYALNERAKMEMAVQSSFTDPGSFFGLMSMCAAHRAVLAGHHPDHQYASETSHRFLHKADYYIMKAKCIREMNIKLRNPILSLSNEAFGTIINLLTSALIVGLFDEARMHLRGLKRMVELRGGVADKGIHQSSMLAAILATDAKAASGLMTQPVLPLVWGLQPVSTSIQKRIAPPNTSNLQRLGIAFFSNPHLSSPLLNILLVMRDLVLYSQACNENPAVLCTDDHVFFRNLNHEVEHQLLSYVYSESNMRSKSFPETLPYLHPIEAVTRIASICYLNHFLVVSPPSSGLGRALTRHLKQAIADSTRSPVFKENHGLLVWALFIGAQGSAGQIERPWFIERLSGIALVCGWRTWRQVSTVLIDYFYLPSTNEVGWTSVWDEAMT